MYIPEITTDLRKDSIQVPEIIKEHASGIKIFGKKIKSFVFTTDIAIIQNNNADAIIAVYPFTPHPSITQAITTVAQVPVFCGVGGGLTNGNRAANIALHAEFQGVVAVVLNATAPVETVKLVKNAVDIPITMTIVSPFTNIAERLDAGATILNVSGGRKTAEIVRKIRKEFPYIPIIATGGPTDADILETIEAGANAITYTPPSNAELFKKKMDHYREIENNRNEEKKNENISNVTT
ncbi:hydrolase [Erysipelotrichaceae bacterium]|nr:hydrolase [Erysipelotrichaceae bacterium]